MLQITQYVKICIRVFYLYTTLITFHILLNKNFNGIRQVEGRIKWPQHTVLTRSRVYKLKEGVDKNKIKLLLNLLAKVTNK